MNRVLIWGLVGALLGGGLAVVIATAGDEGEIFIASDQPITVAQVQEKLRLDGWLNVQVMEQGRYFEVTGVRSGRSRKLLIDSLTGQLIQDDDD